MGYPISIPSQIVGYPTVIPGAGWDLPWDLVGIPRRKSFRRWDRVEKGFLKRRDHQEILIGTVVMLMQRSTAGRCRTSMPRNSRRTKFRVHSLLFPCSLSHSPVFMRVCDSEKKFAVLFTVKFADLSLNSEKTANFKPAARQRLLMVA